LTEKGSGSIRNRFFFYYCFFSPAGQNWHVYGHYLLFDGFSPLKPGDNLNLPGRLIQLSPLGSSVKRLPWPHESFEYPAVVCGLLFAILAGANPSPVDRMLYELSGNRV